MWVTWKQSFVWEPATVIWKNIKYMKPDLGTSQKENLQFNSMAIKYAAFIKRNKHGPQTKYVIFVSSWIGCAITSNNAESVHLHI